MSVNRPSMTYIALAGLIASWSIGSPAKWLTKSARSRCACLITLLSVAGCATCPTQNPVLLPPEPLPVVKIQEMPTFEMFLKSIQKNSPRNTTDGATK